MGPGAPISERTGRARRIGQVVAEGDPDAAAGRRDAHHDEAGPGHEAQQTRDHAQSSAVMRIGVFRSARRRKWLRAERDLDVGRA
jgi:hypothetical protein